MTPLWYYLAGGRICGPLTAEQLQRAVQQGSVTPETPVRQGPAAVWQPARAIPGLLQGTPRPAAPPQPPRAAPPPASAAPRPAAATAPPPSPASAPPPGTRPALRPMPPRPPAPSATICPAPPVRSPVAPPAPQPRAAAPVPPPPIRPPVAPRPVPTSPPPAPVSQAVSYPAPPPASRPGIVGRALRWLGAAALLGLGILGGVWLGMQQPWKTNPLVADAGSTAPETGETEVEEEVEEAADPAATEPPVPAPVDPPEPPAPRPAPTPATPEAEETESPVAPAPPRPTPPPPTPAEPATPEPSPAPTRPRSTEEIVAASEHAVALLRGRESMGTGFLVRRGLLVTNAHVVADEFIDELDVHFPSASGMDQGPWRATLVALDPVRDLAFLSIEATLEPLRLSPDDRFRRGQEVTVIGSPGLGGETILPNAVSRGVLSSTLDIDGQPFYQLGISVNPGNSGGPVFNPQGDVVAVVTSKSEGEEGIAFGIPARDVRRALEQAEASSTEERERQGVEQRARVVVELWRRRANLLADGLQTYIQEMQHAVTLGRPAADGARTAAGRIDGRLNNFESRLAARLQNRGATLLDDARLAAAVRDPLREADAALTRLRSLLDRPDASGTLEQFQEDVELHTRTARTALAHAARALGAETAAETEAED